MSRIEEALEKAALMRTKRAGETPLHRIDPPPQEVVTHQECGPSFKPPPEPIVVISNPLIPSANNPSSSVAEEYRKLKSAIVSMTRRGEVLNTLMVTSTFGSEGKSVTALNLAVSLAQECDNTVLLIDADLRKPSLHKFLGLEPGLGLTDCLASGIGVEKALVKTGIGKLSFLPSGQRLQNPAEMLSSQKMRSLLAEMKQRYSDRYIIIDAPPVLPVAETRSLSSIVDGIVFVVREGVPSPDDIKEACHSLGAGKVIGMVYNDAVSTAHNYSHRYKYERYVGIADSESPAKPVQEIVIPGPLKKLFRAFRTSSR
jgi:exopolysaccharide/PEP-CTERM locus tyrosine autokinase